MDLESRTDEELLLARSGAAAGPAFAAFYRRYERLILAFHFRRVQDPDIATDLTAETFAQALASRKRFAHTGPDSGVRWLYGIASNVLAHTARQAASELRKCEALQIQVPTLNDRQRDDLEALASDDAVNRALAALPRDQREAVRAFVLEDRAYSEIAAALGDSEATVRKRVSRGLSALRRKPEGVRP